ncbi:type II toxin-antitoxin system VapC family toxin [Kumtagia ephedrae]|uniref:Ribonuclease VapC n=1 Tax=Kumtagia ephedrae TaxID=2116701 RepID=A0A2P7S7F7_9HYPH|nr:type II toxin-antitoxin system VapC family toxin [Mesorhizobium ephedrae]PSJ58403.1 VapC toxin family PIN domain ribonuclease [Mesorhizobium ephedrae]
MFLLDTNVVSAARKSDPAVVRWLVAHEHDGLWLSVVTLGEIASGVHQKRRRDPAAARYLERWLEGLRLQYRDRVLDIDDQVAVEWGRIDAIRTRGTADGLIAATAIVHGVAVVTRNVADFRDTGVALFNPWSA